MMRLGQRRLLACMIWLAAAALLAAAIMSRYPLLEDAAYCTGWILLGMMVFLTLYNLRKKLPYPPLFTSSLWLQLHIYIGFGTVLVFPLHIAWRVPDGAFEMTLALVFAAVVLSGVAGLILTRAAPRRLSLRGEEVIFERIPAFRAELRDKAEELVIRSVAEAQATVLADYYRGRLAGFFAGPRHLFWHLFQSEQPLRKLTLGLRDQQRYLNEGEKKFVADLEDLIESKDALDFHYAMQGALRLWLFVHIPLTYVLLILAALHAILVHTFAGSGS